MQPPKPYREERPWGEFVEFTKNTPTTVKIITVKPGEILSLQKHANRDEFWHIISGQGSVVIGEETISVFPGQDYFVVRGTKHRLAGGQSESLVILEISFGDFDENDIERLEDRYGRAGGQIS